MEAIHSGAILVYALRKVDPDPFLATVLVWRMEISPKDNDSPWIEVIGVDGKMLTDAHFATALALFDLSWEQTPPRRRGENQSLARQPSTAVAPEPVWHDLLQAIALSAATTVATRPTEIPNPSGPKRATTPSIKSLFGLYQCVLDLGEALGIGDEEWLDRLRADISTRTKALSPSTSTTINRLAEVIADLEATEVTSATVAVIALRYVDAIRKDLEIAIDTRDGMVTPPYSAPPFDESTRKAFAGLMLHLWGDCAAKLPEYEKKAWNSVCQQLKQIGAIDW